MRFSERSEADAECGDSFVDLSIYLFIYVGYMVDDSTHA